MAAPPDRSSFEPAIIPCINVEGSRLIAEWNTRRMPKDRGITIFFLIFGCGWTSGVVFVTYSLLTGSFDGDGWAAVTLICVWLAFGYAMIVFVVYYWVGRYSSERLQVDDKRFVYEFHGLIRSVRVERQVDEVLEIRYGYEGDVDRSSFTSLRIHLPDRILEIAFWMTDEFRRHLFHAMRRHFEGLEAPAKCVEVDLFESQRLPTEN